MNNEIAFLKYLDNQLTGAEVEEVEKMILENPGQRELFEAVKKKRQTALDVLNMLNPEGEIVVPPFKANPGKNRAFHFRSNFWKYAAAIAIVVTSALCYWLFNNRESEKVATQFSEIASVDPNTIDIENLNYYISPNRCWNRRQLVWTVIDLNN